jgi:hypothetical protein
LNTRVHRYAKGTPGLSIDRNSFVPVTVSDHRNHCTLPRPTDGRWTATDIDGTGFPRIICAEVVHAHYPNLVRSGLLMGAPPVEAETRRRGLLSPLALGPEEGHPRLKVRTGRPRSSLARQALSAAIGLGSVAVLTVVSSRGALGALPPQAPPSLSVCSHVGATPQAACEAEQDLAETTLGHTTQGHTTQGHTTQGH